MKHVTTVKAQLVKTSTGFGVAYTWPSAITGSIMAHQERFQTFQQAEKFIDGLKWEAAFWNFRFLIRGAKTPV